MADAHKVIGYYAKTSKGDYLVSEQRGLIVAESEEALRSYVQNISNGILVDIRKIRASKILEYCKSGKPVSLNEYTYKKFYTIACKYGLDLENPDNLDFKERKKQGYPFLTLMLGD